MFLFRILLFAIAVGLNVYSWWVIYHHGPNLFAVVKRDLMAMSWNGQFDFDLLCFIFLSGFWIAWRHRFSALGLVLGIFGGFLGNAFFAPYLLFLTFRENGDVKKILMGDRT